MEKIIIARSCVNRKEREIDHFELNDMIWDEFRGGVRMIKEEDYENSDDYDKVLNEESEKFKQEVYGELEKGNDYILGDYLVRFEEP